MSLPKTLLLLPLVAVACQGAPEIAGPSYPPSTANSLVAPSPGPLHQEGDRMLIASVHNGQPILRKSLVWDGNGEMEAYGLAVGNLWWVSNRWAFGADLNATLYVPNRDEIWTGELAGVMRYYFLQNPSAGLFVEGRAGFLYGAESVPPGGTQYNETFAFGPGLDVPIGDDVDLFVGVDYHHISNARGRKSLRNPSQDEARFWIGIGFRW